MLTGLTRYAVEIVTGRQPVDPHEENLKKLAESKLILERFTRAWQPPIRILIIDLSVVNYLDTVAVRVLWKVGVVQLSCRLLVKLKCMVTSHIGM